MEVWLTTAKAGPRHRRWAAESKTMHMVYILKSDKLDRHYIGCTSDIEQRLRYHNAGKNKSTKIGTPWRVVYVEQFESKMNAWMRERQIKSYKGGMAFKNLLSI